MVVEGQSLVQQTVEDDATFPEHQAATAEALEKTLRVGSKQKGPSGIKKVLKAVLGSVVEVVVTGTKALVHGQTFMAAAGEHCEQQPSRHTLAVGLDREMNEVTQTGKSNHILLKGVETA